MFNYKSQKRENILCRQVIDGYVSKLILCSTNCSSSPRRLRADRLQSFQFQCCTVVSSFLSVIRSSAVDRRSRFVECGSVAGDDSWIETSDSDVSRSRCRLHADHSAAPDRSVRVCTLPSMSRPHSNSRSTYKCRPTYWPACDSDLHADHSAAPGGSVRVCTRRRACCRHCNRHHAASGHDDDAQRLCRSNHLRTHVAPVQKVAGRGTSKRSGLSRQSCMLYESIFDNCPYFILNRMSGKFFNDRNLTVDCNYTVGSIALESERYTEY